MAKRSELSILHPAYHIVNYRGVPIFRAQAWALTDAANHGIKFTVNSGDRRESTIVKFNRRHGTSLSSQAFLYRMWLQRKPGYNPANPPDRGTHLLIGDGVVGRLFQKLKPWQLGLDLGGDVDGLIRYLNAHGYSVYRPYSSASERHHICFRKSPASNARKRLAAYYRRKK